MTFRSGGLGLTETSALYRIFDRDASRRAELLGAFSSEAVAELKRQLEAERQEVVRLRDENAELRAQLELALMATPSTEAQ